jgi:lantibiotic modifying enzyme
LCARAITSDHGLRWEGPDDAVRLGFAYGSTGIAYFLLVLWEYTGNDRFLESAKAALEFDIQFGMERGDGLVWGATHDSKDHRPYWLRGGGGIVSGLTRFAAVLQDPRYFELARRGARGCTAFFSAGPHLFEGLASMGDALLDMHQLTGESEYLDEAKRKATQIMLYKVRHENEDVFPGRFLMRLSHDYGMGGAGIGSFLLRLLNLGPQTIYGLRFNRAIVDFETVTHHPAYRTV